MGVIDLETVVGIQESQTAKIKCKECMTNEEWENMTEEEMITQDGIETEEKAYFCDYCKKRL